MSGETEVCVETRILGSVSRTMTVSVPALELTVSQFLRAKASAEWAAFCRGGCADVGMESADPDAFAKGLPAPTAESAVIRTAIDGFRAGWYILLVNGAQVHSLDEPLSLSPQDLLSVVRICPLPDAIASPGVA